MSRKLNVGIIGAGFIGQLAHLVNYVEIGRCRVLGLAEFRPELRRKVLDRYGIPRGYATHHEMLKDPDIEAVIVVTPRAYTAPVVFDCLQAGKHVFSEKPMAGNVEQGLKLVEAAKARNLHYWVGYMKRHDEGVQAAKKILDQIINSGELGKLLFVRTHCYMGNSYCNAGGHIVTEEKPNYSDKGWPTSPSWLPSEWQIPFAAYLNTFSHNTNLLRYFFNRTPSVEYTRLDPQVGQLAVLDFGQFVATVESGRASNRGWDEVTEIYFADGHIKIRTPPALLKNVPAVVEVYKAGTIQEVTAPQCDWTWAFRRQAEAFVLAVLEDQPTLTSGADALEDLRLIETIFRVEMNRIAKISDATREDAP